MIGKTWGGVKGGKSDMSGEAMLSQKKATVLS